MHTLLCYSIYCWKKLSENKELCRFLSFNDGVAVINRDKEAFVETTPRIENKAQGGVKINEMIRKYMKVRKRAHYITELNVESFFCFAD